MQKLLSMVKENRFRNMYLLGLIVFAIGLPLSKTAMSLALLWLALHWLVSAGYRHFPGIRSPRGAAFLFFMLIFAIHVAGLLVTTDFTFAFKDLRIKLPLLLLPLFCVTAPPLTRRQVDAVTMTFITAVLAGTFISLFVLLIRKPVEARDLTPFLSHIRFSMMVCLSVFAALWLAFKRARNIRGQLLWGTVAVWLTLSLVMLESLTGAATFILLVIATLIYITIRAEQRFIRMGSAVLLALMVMGLAISMQNAWREFRPDLEDATKDLPLYTARGNPYYHDTTCLINENGNLVWLCVCEDEMREAWNLRSAMPFDNELAPGSRARDVLMRFLASKGLKKDAEGVKALTQAEISDIERGITNYRYDNWSGMQRRFDQLKWEYWNYLGNGDPSGHSLLQRMELWQVGWRIARENLRTGVGTGDIKTAFARQLEKEGSSLHGTPMRTHNQYLTFLITFGVAGAAILLAAFILPLILLRKRVDYLFAVFLIIVLFSMFFEDTLETQAGASFFAFFASLWLFRDEEQVLDSSKLNHA